MRVGGGKCELIFPEGFFPTEGFTVQVHPLFVRALVLGAAKPIVLVSIEMTSLPDDEAERLRETAAASAATRPENVWVTVTHTFSAPHLMPDTLLDKAGLARKKQLRALLDDAVHAAVLQAKRSTDDVEVLFSQRESGLPASRDIELEDGWWVGCNGDGPANRTLTVLQFGRTRPRAILIHMNMQPSVLDGTGAKDGKCVSGDIAGLVSAYFERRYADAVCLCMIGAAGDQAPVQKAKGLYKHDDGSIENVDLGEGGVALAERLSVQLMSEARDMLLEPGDVIGDELSLIHGSVTVPMKKMNRDLHSLHPSRQCEWEPDGEGEQTFSLLRLGELVICGVKPELTYETDAAIKAASPFPHTLIATLVNGSAKYMAARSVYDKCMYEAINSPFMPGAAETLAEAIIGELKGASL